MLDPLQDSENVSVFSQALGKAYPILAALCFLKQRVHFLIAAPEKKKTKRETERGETFGATLSASDATRVGSSSGKIISFFQQSI